MTMLTGNTTNYPSRWTRSDLLIVAALVFVGLALRSPGLNAGLWYDEIATLVNFVRLPAPEIISRFDSLNNHVFYSLCAHLSVHWLGESAWALRLPALLFGTASLPVLYILGRQITERRESLLAAVFLATSYHHVWFSQNARGYTGLALGALLASILFIRLLKTDKASPGAVAAYAATTALTNWIHMTAVFVPLAHGLVLLTLTTGRVHGARFGAARPPTLAILFAGLLTVVFYAPVLPDVFSILAVKVGTPEFHARWHEWGWLVTELVREAQRAAPGGGLLALAAVVTLVTGTISYLKQSAAVAAILVLPVLLTVAAFMTFSYAFFPRFIFHAFPFLLLIAVRGGFALAGVALPFLKRDHVLGIGLVVALASATAIPAAWQPKQDFTAAAKFIDQHREDSDAFICPDLAHLPMAVYLGEDCVRVASAVELERVETRHRRTWLVYTLPIRFEAKLPELWARVQSDYSEIAVFPGSLGGGDVVVTLNSSRLALRSER